jgi:hypothetical protein
VFATEDHQREQPLVEGLGGFRAPGQGRGGRPVQDGEVGFLAGAEVADDVVQVEGPGTGDRPGLGPDGPPDSIDNASYPRADALLASGSSDRPSCRSSGFAPAAAAMVGAMSMVDTTWDRRTFAGIPGPRSRNGTRTDSWKARIFPSYRCSPSR